MNKKNYLFATILAFAFASCNSGSKATEAGEEGKAAEAAATSATYTVDSDASSIGWKGTKVTGEFHTGTIAISSGELAVENGAVSAGKFTIDMNSMVVTDELPDDKKQGLIGHLTNKDFFLTNEHPTGMFEITSIEGNNVSGNLTLKGISKQITFPADIAVSDDGVKANADVTIDRTNWGVEYGSSKLGDMVINDNIELSINVEAK